MYLPFHFFRLRERKDDILFLTDYFIQGFNKKLHKNIQGLRRKLELFFLIINGLEMLENLNIRLNI